MEIPMNLTLHAIFKESNQIYKGGNNVSSASKVR
uniref:Uncharacterized protein n=1 Tax=Anguilla anguilla TaxID=7936 RepID=A0A0E9PNN3_ANGAN